jgi:hypothetical protein
MSWRWGKLELPTEETEDTVALELAHWLAGYLTQAGQDSVIGPDGTAYDIELAVRLVAQEPPAALDGGS